MKRHLTRSSVAALSSAPLPPPPSQPSSSPKVTRKRVGDAEYSWELKVPASELNLTHTFLSGQVFGWKEVAPQSFVGVLRNCIIRITRSDEETIQVNVESHDGVSDLQTLQGEVQFFLQLERYHLTKMYTRWGKVEKQYEEHHAHLCRDFASAGKLLPGLRLLEQDPVVCLFSFVCSQNNNIPRINQMLQKFTTAFGKKLGAFDGVDYFTFPSLEEIAKVTEAQLREMGFGYRAKFIPACAKQIVLNGGPDWLMSLRSDPDEVEVRKKLTSLMGIGEKVADCIMLFSLRKYDLVPVDTHVFQMAQKYLPHIDKLNKVTRVEIASLFQTAFGSGAGWAHTILFANKIGVNATPALKKPTKKRVKVKAQRR